MTPSEPFIIDGIQFLETSGTHLVLGPSAGEDALYVLPLAPSAIGIHLHQYAVDPVIGRVGTECAYGRGPGIHPVTLHRQYLCGHQGPVEDLLRTGG